MGMTCSKGLLESNPGRWSGGSHTLAGDTGASRSPPNLNYEGRAGGEEHFRSLAMTTRVLLLDTEFLETVFSLTVRVSSSPAGLYS